MSTKVHYTIIGIRSVVAVVVGVLVVAQPTRATIEVAQKVEDKAEALGVEEAEAVETELPALKNTASPTHSELETPVGVDAEEPETTDETEDDGPVVDPVDPIDLVIVEDLAPNAPEDEVFVADDLVALLPECDSQFTMGRWEDVQPGTTATFTSLIAGTSGSCESVTIGFDDVSPTVEVMRIPFLNYTLIRFDTDQNAMAPGPDALVPGGDLITGVVAFHDASGPGVMVHHPSGVEVAARTTVDSEFVTVEFRASEPTDVTVDAWYDGEPYHFGFNGSPESALSSPWQLSSKAVAKLASLAMPGHPRPASSCGCGTAQCSWRRPR